MVKTNQKVLIFLQNRNGFNYAVNSDEKFTGILNSKYDNGQNKELTYFRDGIKEGTSQLWYENGQIKKSATYKNNILDGTFTTWEEGGTVGEELIYKLGERLFSDENWSMYEYFRAYRLGEALIALSTQDNYYDFILQRFQKTITSHPSNDTLKPLFDEFVQKVKALPHPSSSDWINGGTQAVLSSRAGFSTELFVNQLSGIANMDKPVNGDMLFEGFKAGYQKSKAKYPYDDNKELYDQMWQTVNCGGRIPNYEQVSTQLKSMVAQLEVAGYEELKSFLLKYIPTEQRELGKVNVDDFKPDAFEHGKKWMLESYRQCLKTEPKYNYLYCAYIYDTGQDNMILKYDPEGNMFYMVLDPAVTSLF